MSALPMLQRCAQHQWAGLPEQDRLRLNALWQSARPISATLLHAAPVAQLIEPLWTVRSPKGELILIGVKRDWLGDVPA